MNDTFVAKDTIIDYAGKEHHFVIAAVRVKLEESDDCSFIVLANGGLSSIRVGLQIGISICNPIDEFDEKVGVLKAIARAKKNDCAIYACYKGQFSDALVNDYLKQEIKYIKENPGKYIKGYEDNKARFLKNQKIKEIEENFTDIEKLIVEGVKKDPTYLNNVQEYLKYLNKCKR